MRTTFRIDDDLMDSLRQEAARERTSIGLVVNRLLRRALTGAASSEKREPFRQRSVGMGQPCFDVNKANELAGEIDDAELIRRMGRGEG